jgi:glycosyltransferase involved in cell wall biosynthesis
LHDLVGGAHPVAMLVPGLAEIPVREAPRTFTAFLSGRLSDDATRIKQGHLGIAAFAKAHREACNSSMPQGLCNQPRLLLRGVDFEPRRVAVPWPPPIDPETELKEFSEEYADRVINLHALPYTQDREELYDELRAASVALMPSWHEGFGLVAWEAIAAGVSLILSQQSGVYRLLDSELPGAGPGCVHAIDVRGAMSHPFFHNEDLKAVATALTGVAKDPTAARHKAAALRDLASRYTWSSCVEQAAEAL